LAAFIKEVDTELAKPLEEGNYDALVNVIGILMRMKERQAATDEMFEPLKQAIELLKIYNQELPDEVHTHLQVRIVVSRSLLLWISLDSNIKSIVLFHLLIYSCLCIIVIKVLRL